MQPAPHSATYRVYYEDTDAGGVVYYANYLRFAERARTDALRDAGISQSALRKQCGAMFVVTRCEVDYLASARLDDTLTVQTQLIDLRKVRMTMEQNILRDGEVLVKLIVHIALIDPSHKPMRMDDTLRRALTGYLTITDR